MENPNIVVKVRVERGEELISATMSLEMAGRFLEYLGVQLKELGVASMPRKAATTARKAGEES